MAAETLEAFRANRRRLRTEMYMQPDKLHDARINHNSKLDLTVPIVDCQDYKKGLEWTEATNYENPV